MNRINFVKKIENYDGYRNLFCIDEGMYYNNPTCTFKDKQPKALLSHIGQKGVTLPLTIGAMSTGNTAFSIFNFVRFWNQIAVRREITPVIYVPTGFEERSYFGPDVNGIRVDGRNYLGVLEKKSLETGGKIIHLDFGDGSQSKEYLSSLRLGKVAAEHGLIKEGGVFLNITEGLDDASPLTLEQISSLTEEQYSQLQKLGIKAYQPIIDRGLADLNDFFGVEPDYVICQFGAGMLFNETRDYLKDNLPEAKCISVAVGSTDSCADKIYPSYWANNPSNLRCGGTTVSKHDNSVIYGVDDWEIGEAMAKLDGRLNAEASGVAGFALLPRFNEIIPKLDKKRDVILTINTGNGIPNFISQ